MVVKTGITPKLHLKYATKSWVFASDYDVPGEIVVNDSYSMVTQGHRGWSSGSGDAGGPFFLSKTTSNLSPGYTQTRDFRGSFLCGDPAGFIRPFDAFVTPSNSSLDAKGTTAIARTEPTKAQADIATFIGELRSDGLPRLRPDNMQRQVKRARAAGSDYLNVEFGWAPLVSDLRKMAHAVKHSHSIIQNYRKHGNGQKIRRRYVFPTEHDTWSGDYGNFIPYPSDVGVFGQGTIAVRRQQDMWFSGAFRYYVPIGDSAAERVAEYASNAQKLLGVDVTPETVWNVSPWSWLVDWQANVGDVLHNISAMGRDGLVMQYGYMMAHSLDEVSKIASYGGAYASGVITSETKVRRPATPYGFGFDMTQLTAKQSAILVALGLSRT
jgi:hypothetical protein